MCVIGKNKLIELIDGYKVVYPYDNRLLDGDGYILTVKEEVTLHYLEHRNINSNEVVFTPPQYVAHLTAKSKYGRMGLSFLNAAVALGFVIIYKAPDILNFAQGEFLMLGAYFCFSLVTTLKLPFLVAFFVTLVFSALLGVTIHYFLLRPMFGKPMFSIVMMTIGLSIVIRSIVGIVWGPDHGSFPPTFTEKPIAIGPLVLSHIDAWAMAVSIMFLIIFGLFFNRGRKNGGTVPGAADNLSASALAVAMCRFLVMNPSYIPDDTEIRFISFGSEEAGCRGSRHYVEQHLDS